MNALKNRVQLIGNLGADPQSKEFDGGKVKTWFSVATNETYRDSQGEKETNTNWHNVVAWGKTAELASKHLSKGSQVAIDGRLNSRSYEKDGEKRYVTEVVANEFMMLDGKKQE